MIETLDEFFGLLNRQMITSDLERGERGRTSNIPQNEISTIGDELFLRFSKMIVLQNQ
jgi:hypothetical protein